ncbi:bifunctional isochorismate lyase/aryl carrier protein|uniref:isochorismatase n=1 Tax=Brenneria salicis ATCC 15712 = DSM 30166 TaxID=714314 RepID=A0A366I2S2_9GAMM|nr:isochorismatase family protein [Brenneria salicis]NMN92969.1 bifunctional isochorismate lyase/aryl carrier protein [Brenneria salicis ATCC 15712 = DSM 30166]RBP61942.1 bifunctional isochorismate lyase/aryl carrier protein [Brenneria salicis ATCC 15712 = DSM 30166]RLM31253.1 isochorismatase [Brenneria salicis ATCC 15712 = DSM 30166]
MSIPKLNSYPLPSAASLPDNKVSWPLEPPRAALLIHDMQNYFLNFWGEDSPLTARLIENIVRLRRFCRQHAIPVFYTAQPNQQSATDRALLNDMWGPGLNKYPEQQAITTALTPAHTDTVLVKWRYSAFLRTDLEQQLREAGRNQLIICGIYAHIGCLTTANDAFMRDIKPFMVADALADFSLEDHMIALRYSAGRCGRVMTTEQLIADVHAEESYDHARLRAELLPFLDEDAGEVGDDENLLDYGLDSVRIMSLAARWRQQGHDVDFVTLVKAPTINHWLSLLSVAEREEA